jgi:hypothetical protein
MLAVCAIQGFIANMRKSCRLVSAWLLRRKDCEYMVIPHHQSVLKRTGALLEERHLHRAQPCVGPSDLVVCLAMQSLEQSCHIAKFLCNHPLPIQAMRQPAVHVCSHACGVSKVVVSRR